MFCLKISVVFLIVAVNGTKDFDVNIRYSTTSKSGLFDYGYINLKRFVNKKLEIVPFLSISVRNETVCFTECLSTNGSCISINIRRIAVDEFQCELLSKDVYRNKLCLNDSTDYNHYAIMVSLFF